MRIFGLRIIKEKTFVAMQNDIKQRESNIKYRESLSVAEISSLLNRCIGLERLLARYGVRMDDSIWLKDSHKGTKTQN